MQIDPKVGSQQSIDSKVINVGGPDPIQGFDVGVFVQDMGRGHKDVLMGQFTNIQIWVKVASEPYKPVGFDTPIYLDGEKQISFTMDKGLLDVNVFRETFGFKTYNWLNRYVRSPRFKITFAIDPVDFAALDEACMAYGQKITRTPSGRVVLEMAKVDEWGLGAEAGRKVVVTQWKGLAQQIWAEPLTLDNMPFNKRSGYDAQGRPTDPIELPTFFFQDYADYASTSPRVTPTSYQLYPDWITPEMILLAEKQVLAGLPDFPGKQALLDSIDRQLGSVRSHEGVSSAINQFSGSPAQALVALQVTRAAVATGFGTLDPTLTSALLASLDGQITILQSNLSAPSGNTGEVRPQSDPKTSGNTGEVRPHDTPQKSYAMPGTPPQDNPTSRATGDPNVGANANVFYQQDTDGYFFKTFVEGPPNPPSKSK